MENSAYTQLSSRDEIVRADHDFIMADPNKSHVFGIYMLCDLKEETGKNDILIEAIPAPSGMVKVVKEDWRGQSHRRIVGIAEASNNMRCRWARTGWITEVSKGLIGLQNEILDEDLTSDEEETLTMTFSGNNTGNGGSSGASLQQNPNLVREARRRQSTGSTARAS